MAQGNYVRCLANTLVEEGGYSNHPNDPGGPTMRGVIQRVYDDWRRKHNQPTRPVRQIEEVELQDIYKTGYADPIDFNNWPKGPDQVAFDICVNSGKGNAVKIMGRALGISTTSASALSASARAKIDRVQLVKTACAKRAAFYRSLRTFSHFGTGWLRRNARMEAIGVKMALETMTAPTVPTLELERKQAEKKAADNGKAATGTATVGGGGGATATQTTEPAGWGFGEWGITIVIILLFIAALGYFWWWWRVHRERVKAYAMAKTGDLEAVLDNVMVKLRG
jgi:lysozyme family protein